MQYRFKMVPRLTLLIVLTILADGTAAVAQEAAEDRAGATDSEVPLVDMPVTYNNVTVVIVHDQGAAALRFTDVRERANATGNGVVLVDYEWRYLPRQPDAVEQKGTGTVFAKFVDGKAQRGHFALTAGEAQVLWYPKTETAGLIQFDPHRVSVHPVTFKSFQDQKNPGEAAKVDLRRFLYRGSENVAQQHGNVAGPVEYNAGALVFTGPSGIATIWFDETFQRQISESIDHYGVSYRFSFTSHDGEQTETGEGMVYEKYLDNKYNQGRLNIEAGPLQLKWSRGGEDLGWVYYDPSQTLVWNVSKDHASSLIDTLSDNHPRDHASAEPQ